MFCFVLFCFVLFCVVLWQPINTADLKTRIATCRSLQEAPPDSAGRKWTPFPQGQAGTSVSACGAEPLWTLQRFSISKAFRLPSWDPPRSDTVWFTYVRSPCPLHSRAPATHKVPGSGGQEGKHGISMWPKQRINFKVKGTTVKVWGSYTDWLPSSRASYTAKDATIGITVAGVVV